MIGSFLTLQFCTRLKEYRKREKLTQSDLACLAGVSKNTISSIETGNSIPSCELGLKLAIILRVKFDDLFYLSLANINSLEQKVGEILLWQEN